MANQYSFFILSFQLRFIVNSVQFCTAMVVGLFSLHIDDIHLILADWDRRAAGIIFADRVDRQRFQPIGQCCLRFPCGTCTRIWSLSISLNQYFDELPIHELRWEPNELGALHEPCPVAGDGTFTSKWLLESWLLKSLNWLGVWAVYSDEWLWLIFFPFLLTANPRKLNSETCFNNGESTSSYIYLTPASEILRIYSIGILEEY